MALTYLWCGLHQQMGCNNKDIKYLPYCICLTVNSAICDFHQLDYRLEIVDVTKTTGLVIVGHHPNRVKFLVDPSATVHPAG